jgi:hypothetical protein
LMLLSQKIDRRTHVPDVRGRSPVYV